MWDPDYNPCKEWDGEWISRSAVVCGVALPHHVSVRHDDIHAKARDSPGNADLVEGQRPCCLAPFLQCACSA